MNIRCRVVDSAGVMYWGDVGVNTVWIERAYLDGTGRTILKTETTGHYYAFAYNDGNLYFTDYTHEYVCIRCHYTGT